MPEMVGERLDLVVLQALQGGDKVLLFELEGEIELDGGAYETDQSHYAENIQNDPGKEGVFPSVGSYHTMIVHVRIFAKMLSLRISQGLVEE